MINGDPTTTAALDIFVKDLGIVLEAAKSLTFPTPMAAAAFQLFVMGSSAGFGKQDDSALVKVYEKLSGITVAQPVK